MAASVPTPSEPTNDCLFPPRDFDPSSNVDPIRIPYDCGPCVAGNYCPGGLERMNPCPDGTFGEIGLLQYRAQCTDCTPGYYCSGVGRTNESALCNPGFYCNGSSERPDPDGTQGWGNECSPGHFCPAGANVETACLAGTYANISRKAECDVCPAGYYCPERSINPFECEPGYFCPNGTGDYTQNECPTGTFNDQYKGMSLSSCTSCPVGEYLSRYSSIASVLNRKIVESRLGAVEFTLIFHLEKLCTC